MLIASPISRFLVWKQMEIFFSSQYYLSTPFSSSTFSSYSPKFHGCCFQTALILVFPWKKRPSFTPNQMKRKISLYVFVLWLKAVVSWMQEEFKEINFVFNFLMYVSITLICYCIYQMCDLRYILLGSFLRWNSFLYTEEELEVFKLIFKHRNYVHLNGLHDRCVEVWHTLAKAS
jgi:hypothetical protein